MDHPFNIDLQEALDSDEAYSYLPDGTWLAGGCGLLAHALKRLIPGGEFVVVGRLSQGIPDHLAYRIEDGGEFVYLDYNGVQLEHELIASFTEECHGAAISIAPLSELEAAGIDVENLYWQTEHAPALAALIERQIGAVDDERVSLCWAGGLCDDLPSVSPSI